MTSTLIPEEWRKIEGFPEYSVSNYGRVKRDANGYEPITNALRNGYELVKMWHYDRYNYRYRHDLVARAFLPNQTGRVCHKNGNVKDNRLSNLEITDISKKLK